VPIRAPIPWASQICAQELQQALEYRKHLVPIVYREASRSRFARKLAVLNWVFIRNADDFVQQLARAIDTDLP
jgi:hypothetical protein